MTEPPDERDQDVAWHLVGEVQELAFRLDQFASSVQLLAAETNANTVARRRDRRVLAVLIVIVGLLCALVGTGAFLFKQQQCATDRSQQFFAAEQDKVSGQVAGLKEIKRYPNDPTHVLHGFNHFIDASQHYLDVIAGLPKC